jgi:hypothetical protein
VNGVAIEATLGDEPDGEGTAQGTGTGGKLGSAPRLVRRLPGGSISAARISSAACLAVSSARPSPEPTEGNPGEVKGGLVEDGSVELIADFQTRAVHVVDGRVLVADGETKIVADEVIAATGFRPDLSLLGELRLELDDRVEAPRRLAPLIDPNLHSCGSVPPHGVDELSHPDSGVFMVGMKSYGRAPTFLLRTGYEQVRSIVAALAGDWDAARQIELVLPETGVCNRRIGAPAGEVAVGAGAAGAGSTHDELLTLEAPPR